MRRASPGNPASTMAASGWRRRFAAVSPKSSTTPDPGVRPRARRTDLTANGHRAPVSEELSWFAVVTRSRHERKVHDQLQSRDVESFLPSVQRWSRWRDRRKLIEWPLFPGLLLRTMLVAQRAAGAGLQGRGAPGLVRRAARLRCRTTRSTAFASCSPRRAARSVPLHRRRHMGAGRLRPPARRAGAPRAQRPHAPRSSSPSRCSGAR